MAEEWDGTAELHWNQIPPNANSRTGLGGKGHWRTQHETKGEWEGIFMVMLLQGRVPKRLSHIHVAAEVRFNTKAKRDMDNYFFGISKPLGDVLARGGWIPDDSPEFYTFDRVRRDPEKGPNRLKLTLSYR